MIELGKKIMLQQSFNWFSVLCTVTFWQKVDFLLVTCIRIPDYIVYKHFLNQILLHVRNKNMVYLFQVLKSSLTVVQFACPKVKTSLGQIQNWNPIRIGK